MIQRSYAQSRRSPQVQQIRERFISNLFDALDSPSASTWISSLAMWWKRSATPKSTAHKKYLRCTRWTVSND